MSYNYAARAVRVDGSQAVLKIGFPGDVEFNSENTALKIFNGIGAVQILEKDKEDAVMLLERALPGVPLWRINNNKEETVIAAKVLKKLWKPMPSNEIELTPLTTWYKGFARHKERYNGNSGSLPSELFIKAEQLFKELLETTPKTMLIYGDFHHNNILSSARDEWLIIDPKGIIGDPAYDTSVFLYNPKGIHLKHDNPIKIIRERIEIFSSELGIPTERIMQWAIAQSVLCAIWTIEDHGTGWENIIKFTETVSELRI